MVRTQNVQRSADHLVDLEPPPPPPLPPGLHASQETQSLLGPVQPVCLSAAHEQEYRVIRDVADVAARPVGLGAAAPKLREEPCRKVPFVIRRRLLSGSKRLGGERLGPCRVSAVRHGDRREYARLHECGVDFVRPAQSTRRFPEPVGAERFRSLDEFQPRPPGGSPNRDTTNERDRHPRVVLGGHRGQDPGGHLVQLLVPGRRVENDWLRRREHAAARTRLHEPSPGLDTSRVLVEGSGDDCGRPRDFAADNDLNEMQLGDRTGEPVRQAPGKQVVSGVSGQVFHGPDGDDDGNRRLRDRGGVGCNRCSCPDPLDQLAGLGSGLDSQIVPQA